MLTVACEKINSRALGMVSAILLLLKNRRQNILSMREVNVSFSDKILRNLGLQQERVLGFSLHFTLSESHSEVPNSDTWSTSPVSAWQNDCATAPASTSHQAVSLNEFISLLCMQGGRRIYIFCLLMYSGFLHG